MSRPAPHPGVVARVVTALTLGVAFSLLALGAEAFWVAFPVGFGGVLPVAVHAARKRRVRRSRERYHDPTPAAAGTPPGTTRASLEALRRQYARGVVGDAEFDRRVEALLAAADGGPLARKPDRGPGCGREQEPARERAGSSRPGPDPNA